MESPGMADVKQHGPYLGLGLYWAWVTVVFYSDALAPVAYDADALVEGIWLWATWSHMLALLVFAALAGRLGSLFSRRAFRAAGALGSAAGSAAVPAALLLLDPASAACSAVVLAASLLVGACSAWYVLQWAELYARRLGEATVPLSMLSFAIGLAAYFVVLVFPPLVATAMAAILPLLGGLAMAACRSGDAEDARPSGLAAEGPSEPPAGLKGGLAVSIVATFVFALCGEMLRMLSLRITGESVNAMGVLYLAGGLAGLAALSAYILLPSADGRRRRITLPLVRNVLLFMAAAFLLAPFLGGRALAVSYGIFGAGFWCFRAISWTVCFMLACRFGYRPVRAIAVLDGAFALSVVVSGQLNLWIVESLKVGRIELTAVSLVAVFVLMLMAIFVLNGKGVSSLLRRGFEGGCGDGEGMRGGSDAPGGGTPSGRDGDVAAAVEAIAADVGLSPRETEVAGLLAKGRSLPFVQSELYISAGTAQTHARHIYRKMNVHSRQEFLDVVEARLAGGAGPGDRRAS